MLQGSREARRLNAAPFAHPPDDLDAVVLSHGHPDHWTDITGLRDRRDAIKALAAGEGGGDDKKKGKKKK